jgi:hypothetical protein
MLIAKEKRASNIGEYLLYMYQVEDLLRACQFDSELINKHIISQYNSDPNTKTEICNWYLGLSKLMEEEKLHKKGHLGFIIHQLDEVLDFHHYLLQNKEYSNYQMSYKKCTPALSELNKKFPDIDNEIQLMVEAIYGVFVLKLKKKPISEETQQSLGLFARLLADLSKKFHEYETGVIKIE